MNLKEIAVKCETIEQKKLVARIISEELGVYVYQDGLKESYIRYSTRGFVSSFETVIKYEIVNYSDLIKYYPKYLIQSGDIVEHSEFGTMRVVKVKDTLVAVGDNTRDSYTLLDDYSKNLTYEKWNISSIVRPNSPRKLWLLEGETIWKRKSEIDIKREKIRAEIDKLTEELNKLGGTLTVPINL